MMFSKKGVLVGAIILMLPLLASAHDHNRHDNGHQKTPVPPVVTPPPKPVTPPVVVPPAPVTPVISGSEVSFTAYLTSYQAGDNSPAGTGTYIDGIEGNAGGIGTYASPITMAVGYVGSKADYAPGTMFYVSSLQKYFVADDTCAECHLQVPKGATARLDMYSGNYSSAAGLKCEDDITANYTVIENPKNSYPVNTTPLFNGTNCIK